MAEPGTSYISIRSCEVLRNNGMYSKKRQLIDLFLKKDASLMAEPGTCYISLRSHGMLKNIGMYSR